MKNGKFVKLHDDWLEWEWWGRWPHHPLFEWLLIKARVYDQRIQGIAVRRGSVLTTWGEMQKAVGCSRGTLSRALRDLSECGEIITISDCQKTIVTVCHYEDYNGSSGELWTANGLQTDCKRTATPIIKEESKNEKDIYSAYAQGFPGDDGFVSDTDCRQWMQRYNHIAASFGAKSADQLNTKRRMYIVQRVRERGRGSVDVMFRQLERSAHFFGDGSHGFRGDFTNLWTADVYTKVCEGYYIPKQKETKGTQEKKPAGQGVFTTDEPAGRQPREEWRRQMFEAARKDPGGAAAKVVASWSKEEQGKEQQ